MAYPIINTENFWTIPCSSPYYDYIWKPSILHLGSNFDVSSKFLEVHQNFADWNWDLRIHS